MSGQIEDWKSAQQEEHELISSNIALTNDVSSLLGSILSGLWL